MAMRISKLVSVGVFASLISSISHSGPLAPVIDVLGDTPLAVLAGPLGSLDAQLGGIPGGGDNPLSALTGPLEGLAGGGGSPLDGLAGGFPGGDDPTAVLLQLFGAASGGSDDSGGVDYAGVLLGTVSTLVDDVSGNSSVLSALTDSLGAASTDPAALPGAVPSVVLAAGDIVSHLQINLIQLAGGSNPAQPVIDQLVAAGFGLFAVFQGAAGGSPMDALGSGMMPGGTPLDALLAMMPSGTGGGSPFDTLLVLIPASSGGTGTPLDALFAMIPADLPLPI